jgi:uncharacterized damage-inducible protein DinB
LTPVDLTPAPGRMGLPELLAYSEYMRERFSMAILEMPAGLLTAALGLDWMFRDIRDLFAHMIDCEDQWVRAFVRGGEPVESNPDRYPDAASLVRRWEQVRALSREHLAGADEAEMARVITVQYHGTPRFTVRQVFMQLFVHEIHHRGQITAAMRMRGIAPPPSDLYDYLAEQLQ